MDMLLRIVEQTKLPALCEQWSAEGLLKLNFDLGILNVYLESLIFQLIGSGILNVVLQIFSVLVSKWFSMIDFSELKFLKPLVRL